MSVAFLFNPRLAYDTLIAVGPPVPIDTLASDPFMAFTLRWTATALAGANGLTVFIACTAFRRGQRWAAVALAYWPLMFLSHLVLYRWGSMSIVHSTHSRGDWDCRGSSSSDASINNEPRFRSSLMIAAAGWPNSISRHARSASPRSDTCSGSPSQARFRVRSSVGLALHPRRFGPMPVRLAHCRAATND